MNMTTKTRHGASDDEAEQIGFADSTKPGTSDAKPIPGSTVAIFDPGAVKTQLRLGACTADEPDASWNDQPAITSSSPEEQSRLERLRALIFTDPRRRLLHADTAMRNTLAFLRDECPAFIAVIDLIDRALALSHLSGTGIAFPPILLCGAPGIGKTHFSRRLADALGTEQHQFSCGTNSDAQALIAGHPPSWKGARMGSITEALLGGAIANPLIVLDEVDKFVTHASEKPYNSLLALIEPENAVALVDEYLRIPFDLSHCLILATANDVDVLPEFIRDRFLIVDVPAPSGAGLLAVTRRIARTIIAGHGNAFAEPDETVITRLARAHPRRIRRVLTLSLGYAAAAGRNHLIVADIDAAEQMAAGTRTAMPIGFIRSTEA
ncbi:ATPase family associated with various cellular activities (AAA) [Bosea sp. CRIB-10]|uniref:AAA family ATPase n=1 Tax=Bosea sp. CRIB-10 TaxID=378404 RepID=UPI0008E747CC|nr:AAA family ATPase [Bosea sp. CRIB-10]SFC10919.1 ATPase family associated with various cellular activities (AAA) [Bosea sp. CRIB-10]